MTRLTTMLFFLLLEMFLDINAVAVILVAKGHGLIAVINPSINADNIGIL